MDKADLILELCNKYRHEVVKENGISIGNNSEKYRLKNNGILFHELNYEEIQASCIGLSNVLIYKGMNTIIDYDHKYFWSWVGEVFLSREIQYFNKEEYEIEQLFKTLIRLCNAGNNGPAQTKEEWDEQRIKSEMIDFNTKEVILNSHLIIAYLSFPFLEAVLKRNCSDYVDYFGSVKLSFWGKSRQYNIGAKCSSLRDLLILYYNNVIDISFKKKIDLILGPFVDITTKDPFDQIYEWRNSSLHGSTNYSTLGGTIFNLSILIALNEIRERYDAEKDKIVKGVIYELETFKHSSSRSPWSYYPPY